jgi:hypothetical protein
LDRRLPGNTLKRERGKEKRRGRGREKRGEDRKVTGRE